VVPALHPAGRVVNALDARGHGTSGKPHDPAAYGDLAMSRDPGQMLDVIGATVVTWPPSQRRCTQRTSRSPDHRADARPGGRAWLARLRQGLVSSEPSADGKVR
jgi:hypothetical protein